MDAGFNKHSPAEWDALLAKVTATMARPRKQRVVSPYDDILLAVPVAKAPTVEQAIGRGQREHARQSQRRQQETPTLSPAAAEADEAFWAGLRAKALAESNAAAEAAAENAALPVGCTIVNHNGVKLIEDRRGTSTKWTPVRAR